MTLIDDNDIKELRWIFWVIYNFLGSLIIYRGSLKHRLKFRRLVYFFTTKDGVHTLNGADANMCWVRYKPRLQAVDPIKLRKRAVVIIRPVCKKFPLGLFAKALGINEEQNTVDTGMLEQAIYSSDCSKGFTGSGCHLYKGFGSIGSKRLFQLVNRRYLTRAETSCIKGWKMLHAVSYSVRLLQQALQFLRLMKTEHSTWAVLYITVVGEASQLSGCFISKTDAIVAFYPFEGAVYIAVRLIFYSSDIFTGIVLFSFNNAYRRAINKEGIVYRPGAGWKFAHCYAQSRKQIELLNILHYPAGLDKFFVN